MTIAEFHKIWKDQIEIFNYGNTIIEYVTIHPFGDEEKLLNKIKVNPRDCKYVGSYIKLKQKLFFVEFEIVEELNHNFEKGIHFSKRDDLIYSKYIVTEEYLKKSVIKDWIIQIFNNYDKLDLERLRIEYSKFI